MTTITTTPLKGKVVSRQQWLDARQALLELEKAHTRQRDAISRQRRQLPWVKVDKAYTFETPQGKQTLAELFAGRSQLIVYHFMLGPEWAEGCPSCSFVCDHLDGALPHLAARDVSLVMVSRAPLPKIQAFKKRMGWRFPWVSSFGTDFNYDFQASFKPDDKAAGEVYYNYTRQDFPSEEAPGASVFYKDPATGETFHTYSTYARGLDPLVGTYQLLDLVPKGRDEDHLAFSMEWVRHHDRYGTDLFLDPGKPYWPTTAPAADATTAACGCGHAEKRS